MLESAFFYTLSFSLETAISEAVAEQRVLSSIKRKSGN